MWNFIEKQLLGMQWLKQAIFHLISMTGMDMESRVADSLVFFIYDIIKIFVLLSVLIFAVSYVQSYFPPERTKKILGRFKGISANLMGALLGTVTPFCSCSSIPIFIGFTNAGLPLGMTSFLFDFFPVGRFGGILAFAQCIRYQNRRCVCSGRNYPCCIRRSSAG